MFKLSLAMIVKNEEKNIARCLKSVENLVDEIIVVDTGSEDKTKEAVSLFHAKIFEYPWEKDFAKARNYSIEKATGDFVLVLDADEEVVSFQKDEALSIIKNNNAIGRICLMNEYFDNDEKTILKDHISRLFPKDIRYEGRIHEQLDSPLNRINVPITVRHDGYLNRDAAKAKRNIEILELELKNQKNPYFLYQLAKEYRGQSDFAAADKLLEESYKTTNKKQYYFPGMFILYFKNLMDLKKYDAALNIINSEEDYLKDFPDFHFQCGLFYTDLVLSNPQKYLMFFDKIEICYKTCLKIGETEKYKSILGMGSFLPLHNLGAFYEVTGQYEKAVKSYEEAARLGYSPSKQRLLCIQKGEK